MSRIKLVDQPEAEWESEKWGSEAVIETMHRPHDLLLEAAPGSAAARSLLDGILATWRTSFQSSKGIEHVVFKQEAG